MIYNESALLAQLESAIRIENTDEIFDKLTHLLYNAKSPTIINKTALLLMDNYEDIAASPLITALGNSNTQTCKGTILYALSNLNCADYFDDLFNFILSDGFEISRQAFNVIENMVKNVPYQKRQEKSRILVKKIREKNDEIDFFLLAYEMLMEGKMSPLGG